MSAFEMFPGIEAEVRAALDRWVPPTEAEWAETRSKYAAGGEGMASVIAEAAHKWDVDDEVREATNAHVRDGLPFAEALFQAAMDVIVPVVPR